MSTLYKRKSGVWAPLGGTSTPVQSASTPGSPTNVVAVAGDTTATLSWNPPTSDGGSAITSYTVTTSPGGAMVTTGSTSTVISGLTNGNSYTFTVHATNGVGSGPESVPSNSVSPQATNTQLVTPTATNTGPRPGTTLATISGDLHLTDNQHVSNVHVTGNIWAAGNNCSVDNFICDGWLMLNEQANGTPSNGTNTGTPKRGMAFTYGKFGGINNIGGYDITLDHTQWFGNTSMQIGQYTQKDPSGNILWIAGCRNLTITNNYWVMSDTAANVGHREVLHLLSIGVDSGKRNVIRNNVMDMTALPSSRPITAVLTFELQDLGGGPSFLNAAFDVDRNIMRGGISYHIYWRCDASSTYTNNTSTSPNSGCSFQFPPGAYTDYNGTYGNPSADTNNTWQGNPVHLARV